MDKVSASMISPGRQVYSDSTALAWALDVAAALQYLHGRSPALLHRDVKLSNVLLAKEEGGAGYVAKLSDFGLHVVLPEDPASGMLPGTALMSHISLEASSIVAALEAAHNEKQQQQQQQPQKQLEASLLAVKGSRSNSPLHSVGWSQLTQQHLQELQQQLNSSSTAEQPAAACLFCDKAPDSAQQLCRVAGAARGCGRQGCPAAQQAFYGEMHDSSGSVPYVGMTPGCRNDAAAAAGSAKRAPPRRAASFGGGPPAASAMAAAGDGAARRTKGGPKRSVSFRLEPQTPQQADAAGAAVAGSSSRQARPWPEAPDCFADDASVCSAATMATWVSGSTQCTGTSCSSDISGSITEAERLFNMTGKTGSYLYMAPEVWKNQPYNEKADVFSFGVVLFELMSRCLLIFTELPTSTTDPAITERYAEKVSQGYRPARPKRLADGVWALVQDCWQQQPAARPAMASVVARLQALLEQQQQAGQGSRRSSFSFSGPGTSRHSTASAGHGAGGAGAASNDAAGGAADAASGGAAVQGVHDRAELTAADTPKGCSCVIC